MKEYTKKQKKKIKKRLLKKIEALEQDRLYELMTNQSKFLDFLSLEFHCKGFGNIGYKPYTNDPGVAIDTEIDIEDEKEDRERIYSYWRAAHTMFIKQYSHLLNIRQHTIDYAKEKTHVE